MQIQPVDAAYFEGDVVTDNVRDVGRHSILLGGKVEDGTPTGGRRYSHRSQHQTAAQRPRPEGSPESRRGNSHPFCQGSLEGAKLLLVGLRRSFTANSWKDSEAPTSALREGQAGADAAVSLPV